MTEQEERKRHNDYLSASERVEKMKCFYINLTAFIVVIPFLIFINYMTYWGYQWFWYPMFGWGVGILIHGVMTFGISDE